VPRAELQEVYEQTTAATVQPVLGSDGTRYRLRLRFRTAAQASRKMSFSKAKTYKNSTQFNMGPWPTKEDALKMAVKSRNTVEFGRLTAEAALAHLRVSCRYHKNPASPLPVSGAIPLGAIPRGAGMGMIPLVAKMGIGE